MSWLFSRAMAEDSLRGQFSDGGQYVQWRSVFTQDLYWSHGKTMDHSDLSRYGMTSRHLTDADGEVWLTSFLADFPVRLIPKRLRGEIMQKISGQKCAGSWQMQLPGTYLPRTYQDRPSMPQQTTSKRWATKPSQFPLERKTWVVTTYGTDIGYLHTPTTKANYCADSMQKWQTARTFRMVFGRPDPGVHEWMMGWPQGWSDIPALETGKYQSWLSLHYD